MPVTPSTSSTGFDRFGLHESLLRGIRAAGFESPRPIQRDTIPAGLDGRDVLGLAQTGTGKTAAFALPLLDRLLDERRPGPRVLVIAPTRELATQIATEIGVLSKFTPLRTATVFGGVSIRSQINALRRRPEIVVGCPGRILDLMWQGILHLDRIETLVLDEADHMFDMGFLPDLRKILAELPAERQNLLFSATMPKEIRRLADGLLVDPHVVEPADAAPVATIDHALYPVTQQRKRALLEHLLTRDDCESAIVFMRTKRNAKRLAKQLSEAGHRAVDLQGNLSQSQRDRAMRGFRTRRYRVLVATDIAARGIDVSGVSHVINFDVPSTPEAYTHRIGRTGRAGLAGTACTFVTSSDRDWVNATERMIGAAIPRRQIEGFHAGGHDRPARRPAPQGEARRAPAGSRPRARASAPGSGRRRRRPGGGGWNAGRPARSSGGSRRPSRQAR